MRAKEEDILEIVHKARLIEQSIISPSTRWFRFESAGAALPFEPGQFYRLTLSDSEGEFERSYSFSQTDLVSSDRFFELIVSEVEGGRATEWLFNAELGAEVSLKGPYGRLLLPDPPAKKLLLVATSVGLAPFLPMLAQLRVGPSAVEQTLVHLRLGVRSPDEFIYQAYLQELKSACNWFDLSVYFSRQLPVKPQHWHHSGYVTKGLDQEPLDPIMDRALLCGNPMMVDDVYKILRSRGFGPRSVVREKYVFASETRASKVQSTSSADQALLKDKIARYAKGPKDNT